MAFVIDAYSRRILGWRSATTMTVQLVLDAVEHAIWTRKQQGVEDLSGLIPHHDRGAQHTAGPWRTVDQVEVATLEWVDWFNHRRLYEHCGDVPPAELEAAYYRRSRAQQPAELSNH